MRQTLVNRTVAGPLAPCVGSCALLLFVALLGSRALAQAPTPPPVDPAPAPVSPAVPVVAEPATPATTASDAATDPAGPDATAGQLAADVAALKAELAETRAKLEQVQTRQDDAEVAALTSPPEETAPQDDPLRVYGFADMGVQGSRTPASAPSIGPVSRSRATRPPACASDRHHGPPDPRPC